MTDQWQLLSRWLIGDRRVTARIEDAAGFLRPISSSAYLRMSAAELGRTRIELVEEVLQ